MRVLDWCGCRFLRCRRGSSPSRNGLHGRNPIAYKVPRLGRNKMARHTAPIFSRSTDRFRIA